MRRHLARILIADDDLAFCEVACVALREEGYLPHAVQTHEAAMDALQHDAWSLVVLVSLGSTPGASFKAMLARLSAVAGNTPFLLATGWKVEADIADRVAAVVRKPFDLEEFLEVVRDLVAAANARGLMDGSNQAARGTRRDPLDFET